MDNEYNRDKLIRCLDEQINEINLLKSMYTEKNEFVLYDPMVLEEIENFLKTSTDFVPRYLDFIINLQIANIKLEISISLPSYYPDIQPNIHIRSNQLNRHQESSLNSELNTFMTNSFNGEVCVYTAILWLLENTEKYCEPVVVEIEKSNEEPLKYSRYWIYSHHIYNKEKKEMIVKMAKKYELNGFCCTGKPGIICIEGNEISCNEWWKIIKSLHWKKLVIRKTEELSNSIENKFKNFTLIEFSNHSMSQLSQYLEKISLQNTLREILGLDLNDS